MEILLIFLITALLIVILVIDRIKYNQLRRIGIKVSGTIIANREVRNNVDFYRLGGNINRPTVRFNTQNGHEVIGYPVLGFVTQHEVRPPVHVVVFYDPKQPDRFCIDFK